MFLFFKKQGNKFSGNTLKQIDLAHQKILSFLELLGKNNPSFLRAEYLFHMKFKETINNQNIFEKMVNSSLHQIKKQFNYNQIVGIKKNLFVKQLNKLLLWLIEKINNLFTNEGEKTNISGENKQITNIKFAKYES